MSYSSLCLFLINEEHKVWISFDELFVSYS